MKEDMTWKVKKRFTDFKNLHIKLKSLKTSLGHSFPTSLSFGRDMNIEFIEERRLKLETYLNSIPESIKNSNTFIEFIGENDESIEKFHRVRHIRLYKPSYDSINIDKNLIIEGINGEPCIISEIVDKLLYHLKQLQEIEDGFNRMNTPDARLNLLSRSSNTREAAITFIFDIITNNLHQKIIQELSNNDSKSLEIMVDLVENFDNCIKWNDELSSRLDSKVIEDGLFLKFTYFKDTLEYLMTNLASEYSNKKKSKIYQSFKRLLERIQYDIKDFKHNPSFEAQLNEMIQTISSILNQKNSLSIHDQELSSFESELYKIIDNTALLDRSDPKKCYQNITSIFEKIDSLTKSLLKWHSKLSNSTNPDLIAHKNRIEDLQESLIDIGYRIERDYMDILERMSITIQFNKIAKNNLLKEVIEDHIALEEELFEL